MITLCLSCKWSVKSYEIWGLLATIYNSEFGIITSTRFIAPVDLFPLVPYNYFSFIWSLFHLLKCFKLRTIWFLFAHLWNTLVLLFSTLLCRNFKVFVLVNCNIEYLLKEQETLCNEELEHLEKKRRFLISHPFSCVWYFCISLRCAVDCNYLNHSKVLGPA